MFRKFSAALMAVLLVACAYIDETSSAIIGVNGEKGSFGVIFTEAGEFTKGTLPLDGSLIENVHLFIFNEEGVPIYKKYFPDNNVVVGDIAIYSKDKYTLYALANWGEELEADTEQELESLMCSVQDVSEPQNDVSAAILHGKLEKVHLHIGETIAVGMQRVLGKVQVECDFSRLGSGVTVEVKEVAIRNVPLESSLFRDNAAIAVADGKVYGEAELLAIADGGVEFYMFENMQGSVPGATGNKSKASLLTAERRALCTYIEMKCYLVTNAHRGDMVYRFYLGTTHSDCNVLRNAVQKITVQFAGNVSENEYSVSVDNTALLDRVTIVSVYPAAVFFSSPGVGRTVQFRADTYPATAFDKRVSWESTDPEVAVVSETGFVRTTGVGECYIVARSVENPSEIGRAKIGVM